MPHHIFSTLEQLGMLDEFTGSFATFLIRSFCDLFVKMDFGHTEEDRLKAY